MDPVQNMNTMMPPGTFGHQPETNLWSIILNIAFGFVLGLIYFFGPKEVIDYGSKLAASLMKSSGYGQQASAYGLATTAAPYIILAPLGTLVIKQLSSVRSFKSFIYFLLAVIVGLAVAYFTKGYFTPLIT